MALRKMIRRHRRGAVAVEMALMLPLLFLFVLTSVEFGRMNVIRHTLDNAAYEAARRGIVPGVTVQDVENVATVIMRTCGARGVDIDVEPRFIQRDTPEITVRVSVDCAQNGFIAPKFFRNARLEGVSTLRRESL